MLELLESIAERAEDAGFETSFLEGDGSKDRRLLLSLPFEENDEKRSYVVGDKSTAELIAGSEFDSFRPLERFEAIWSSEKAQIECAVESRQRIPLSNQLGHVARRLGIPMESYRPGAIDREFYISVPGPLDDVEISLKYCSIEFAFYRSLGRRGLPFRAHRLPAIPTLLIKGISAAAEHDAEDKLEKIANSVLFQLDLATGYPLQPARPFQRIVGSRRRTRIEGSELNPPEYEYDPEAMNLYWYARSAGDMPLLRFLALYQVLEFYFPRYSDQQLQDEVRRVLKDPRFRVSRSSDLSRLIRTITRRRTARGYGEEREQLQATVQACVSKDEMREFFLEEPAVLRFFSRDSKKRMPLVPVQIPLHSKKADLRPDVAERIYQIRCRIVYSKPESDVERILLPLSREAKLLGPDTQLVEFVAQRVLIASSRRLRV